jgi:outer membrane protein
VEIDVMKKTLLALAIVAVFAPSFAMAEKGDIVVRLRATQVAPDEKSKLDNATFGANSDLKVDNNTIPELDISYYFTKNIAAELILALGTRHKVEADLNGTKVDLGKVNLLPPTLLAQWHFNPDQTFDPYLGAGISYIRAMDNSLSLPNSTDIHISRNNWGAALQAGLDFNLENKWLLNVDVKKIWFDTTVRLDGVGKIDNLDIDPWVVSVGFGKKF